jgi:MFS family permease
MLVLSLFAYGIFGSTGLYIESAWLLLGFRFLQGMATAGIGAATVAIVGNGFKGGTRSWLLGLQHALLAAAGGVALAIAGYVANIGGWRAPFGLYLTSFVMIALVLAARFDDSAGVRRRDAPVRAIRDLLPMWPTFVTITALYFASYMFFLQLPFVMSGDGIANPADRSAALLWITITMFVSGSLYGGVIQRLGRRWTLVVILALMAASCVLVGVTHGLPMASVACGLVGLGGGGLGAYVADMVLWEATPELRGRATGFMYMSMYIGDFLNPPIVTPLRGLIGNHEAFGVVGILLVLGALAAAIWRSQKSASISSL